MFIIKVLTKRIKGGIVANPLANRQLQAFKA
jgi:hypothetical protein